MLTIALCIGIFCLSHASGTTTSRQSRRLSRLTKIPERVLRIGAHFFCYFILGLVGSFPWWALMVFAFFDEWSKQFVEGRHYCWWEALINVVSVAGGICIRRLFWL